MLDAVDYTAVKPYADHSNDSIVQISFTLPIPYTFVAQKAAIELAHSMGLNRPEVIHYQQLVEGYTYFIIYGECTHTLDFTAIKSRAFEVEYMSKDEIEHFVHTRVKRKIVVIGASTGTDTHSIGIDAMLNLKGFNGEPGLEAYNAFQTYNLGSQVPNSVFVAKAIEVDADALLVSQTVSQQKLHIHNLTQLVDIVEAEGIRKQLLLICGGPRISNELAKELGFDAGFSKGTYPTHVATFIAKEIEKRNLNQDRCRSF